MPKPKLTYASVVSTLALFLALGGVGYAAVHLPRNSVGTSQLKNGAVTAAKIKEGAVSASKLDSSALGTVPNATHASSADSATSAKTAEIAKTASVADRADSLPPVSIQLVGEAGSTFGPGWTKYANQSPPPVFYKDQTGIVHLEGEIKRTEGLSPLMLNLPAADAPEASEVFPVVSGPNSERLASIEVLPTGEVVVLPGGDEARVFLNGVTWRAR